MVFKRKHPRTRKHYRKKKRYTKRRRGGARDLGKTFIKVLGFLGDKRNPRSGQFGKQFTGLGKAHGMDSAYKGKPKEGEGGVPDYSLELPEPIPAEVWESARIKPQEEPQQARSFRRPGERPKLPKSGGKKIRKTKRKRRKFSRYI